MTHYDIHDDYENHQVCHNNFFKNPENLIADPEVNFKYLFEKYINQFPVLIFND